MLTAPLSRELLAQLSLAGMGLDVLGGCYLAYDLLGGRRGPLRTLTRATGYVALFFVGYMVVLGLRYAVVAASGMGVLLAVEFRLAGLTLAAPKKPLVLLFGFLRGMILGLASMTIAGSRFAAIFALLSGTGLMFTYALGFAPTHDYETQARPHVSQHKLIASLLRAIVVSIGGVGAALLTQHGQHWILFGVRLGLAAGTVSALLSLSSPMIEWHIENLPERRLGMIGLVLIFLGVLLQSIQYWVVIFEVAVN
ncbi:MAG: hypothetical protein JO356_11675 [Acidobacteria bacterium]|nr:hypothetical protein [Acidobacteriota bacterium]